MSSSPSTRFDGSHVDGLTEAEMPALPLQRYMQSYAETKAQGEMALTAACCDELMTVAVAPHQVGPWLHRGGGKRLYGVRRPARLCRLLLGVGA